MGKGLSTGNLEGVSLSPVKRFALQDEFFILLLVSEAAL